MRSAEQLAALQEACFRRTAEKLQPGYREQLSPQDVQATRRHISENLAELLAESGLFLSQVEQELLVARVLDDILYSGPITGLLRDPDVSEIFINGPDKVYVNEGGRRRPTDVRFRDEAHLLQTIEGLIAPTGRPLSKGPVIDRQLPDGTRVTVVLPPLSAQGAVVTIRKSPVDLFSVDDLVQLGTLSPEMALFLKACVRAKINILVAGGRGAGKTALLNVLGSFIPEWERIITVEETPGLRLPHEHVVNLVWSQAAGEAKACEGADTESEAAQQALLQALLLRPDRLLVDPVQGTEAVTLLQAMNRGNEGTIFTMYGQSAADAIGRLETLVMTGAPDLPLAAVQRQVSRSVQLVVHVATLRDNSRKVTKICEAVRTGTGLPVLRDLFVYENHGMGPLGRIAGVHQATGIVPRFLAQLDAAGEALPREIFKASSL
ncbi:MAG TPA: ATPase, T2SS/T4P/T4SS family [Sphingobacteriaceae bacterium]|nr:ATPase, T2SS/T4P/T4SS family [Sphingobacteriaceae bacterium]